MSETRAYPRLGEILVASRVITNEELGTALELQSKCHKPLGAILIERNMAAPYEVAQAVARQVGLLAVNLDTFKLHPDALSLLPVELCREHEVLAVQTHGDMVIVAMARPQDDEAYAAIREALAPRRVRCVVANESQIRRVLQAMRTPQPQVAVA